MPASPNVLPSPNLPKGGGAIRNFSESVSVGAFTGSFSFNIPFSLPSARDIMPPFSISYDSGNGNDLFGIGFSLEEQCISRRTRLSIPRYDQTDTFTLNGAELVPKDGIQGEYVERHQLQFPYIKQHNPGQADCYWELVSGDN